jgi:hypothetical protein
MVHRMSVVLGLFLLLAVAHAKTFHYQTFSDRFVVDLMLSDGVKLIAIPNDCFDD